MGVHDAIREAEALLPGTPIDDGDDPRWGAILEVAYFIESEPEAVWAFIYRWGAHSQEDLRDAGNAEQFESLQRLLCRNDAAETPTK